MAYQKPNLKSNGSQISHVLIALGVLGILAFILLPMMGSKSGKSNQAGGLSLSHGVSVLGAVDTYSEAWDQVQHKVNSLRHADQDNYKLRIENSNLKLNIETVQFNCSAQGGLAATRDYELKLSKETGTKVGRTLASLNYKPPARLLPSQLYTLGITYLKAHEDEKAASIFTSLTGLEDNDSFKTAQNLLITGVAWYRLENYTLADFYFDEVIKKPERGESVQFQAQARLWKAIIAKRTSKETMTQHWLRELIDHHPHSMESAWINSGGSGHAAPSEE